MQKQPKCSLINEWIKKVWYTQTYKHKNDYSAIKKDEFLPFVTTWMDLEDIILSEISQRKASITLFYLYVGSKKQNKQKQNAETDP